MGWEEASFKSQSLVARVPAGRGGSQGFSAYGYAEGERRAKASRKFPGQSSQRGRSPNQPGGLDQAEGAKEKLSSSTDCPLGFLVARIAFYKALLISLLAKRRMGSSIRARVKPVH